MEYAVRKDAAASDGQGIDGPGRGDGNRSAVDDLRLMDDGPVLNRESAAVQQRVVQRHPAPRRGVAAAGDDGALDRAGTQVFVCRAVQECKAVQGPARVHMNLRYGRTGVQVGESAGFDRDGACKSSLIDTDTSAVPDLDLPECAPPPAYYRGPAGFHNGVLGHSISLEVNLPEYSRAIGCAAGFDDKF